MAFKCVIEATSEKANGIGQLFLKNLYKQTDYLNSQIQIKLLKMLKFPFNANTSTKCPKTMGR